MTKYRPIIIVPGEPNSVFFEIFFKSLKNKIHSPIILVGSYKLLKLQMKSLKYKIKVNLLNHDELLNYKLRNNSINIIDVEYNFTKSFQKKSKRYNQYIEKTFQIAFKIIKNNISNKFINGPISKKTFLKNKYLGVTEYISDKFNIKKNAMLIYNKELSVCPVTTHLPIKLVAKKISKKKIIEKVELINKFYKYYLNKKPKIAVLGLNPHCESVHLYNEDEKIIKPTVNFLKKNNYSISGPYSADTMFLKQNRKKFDVILGMYHDQVLIPIKSLFEYDAINITLGLPFIRISPDHGPNEKMLGKNISNPLSLIRAISFLDKK